MYSGERIPVLGSLEVEVEYESQMATLPLLVVKGNRPCLLGRNWMAVIRLNWNRICKVDASPSLEKVLRKHPDVFREELGLLRGATAKINIQSEPTLKFFKACTVSYFLREKVDKELQRLQDQEIISPVTFSDWAAPIVPVLKTDGNVRICGDYKVTVNPVAHSDAYPLPRVEDLFADLAGGKVFSKFDLAHQAEPSHNRGLHSSRSPPWSPGSTFTIGHYTIPGSHEPIQANPQEGAP